MKPSVVFAGALLAFGAAFASAEPASNAAEAKAAILDKAKEIGLKIQVAQKSKKAPVGHRGDKPEGWTDMGVSKAVLMDFDTLQNFEPVADTYPGIEWDRAFAGNAALYEAITGWTSNLPSKPNGMLPVDFLANFPIGYTNAYASMTAETGFVGGISFYYATNSEFSEEVLFFAKEFGLHYQLPKVVAFSGPDGEGKVLGSVDLPWTKGNYTFTFKNDKLVWKGVAKSIAFYAPTVEGTPLGITIAYDNIKAIAPSGELATKVADKIADAEAELTKVADKLKNMLMD